MKIKDKIVGGAGLILFLFALVYYSIQNIWGILNWISLIYGRDSPLGNINYNSNDCYTGYSGSLHTQKERYQEGGRLQELFPDRHNRDGCQH